MKSQEIIIYKKSEILLSTGSKDCKNCRDHMTATSNIKVTKDGEEVQYNSCKDLFIYPRNAENKRLCLDLELRKEGGLCCRACNECLGQSTSQNVSFLLLQSELSQKVDRVDL